MSENMQNDENEKKQELEKTKEQPKKIKYSILDKARQQVDVDLGIKEKVDGNEIRSDVAKRRLRKMKQTRIYLAWMRRGVFIFAALALVYLFMRYSFYSFSTYVSEYEKGDKVLLDDFIGGFPLVSEKLSKDNKVIFYTNPKKTAVSVARIFAVAGDKIEFEEIHGMYFIKINGEIHRDIATLTATEAEKCKGVVPAGHFLLIDDADSDGVKAIFDSRQAGFIPKQNIFARVLLVWSRARDSGQ